MNIGEFVLDIFVDAGRGELTVGSLTKALGALEVVSVGEIAVLGALADSLSNAAKAAVSSAIGLDELTAKTGMSTEKFEEWQAVGDHLGYINGEISSSFLSISEAIADFPTGKQSPILNLVSELGVSLDGIKASEPEKLFDRIRVALSKSSLPPAEQFSRIKDAGLGPVFQALFSGKGGVSEKDLETWKKEATHLTDAQIRAGVASRNALVSLHAHQKKMDQGLANAWIQLTTLLNKAHLGAIEKTEGSALDIGRDAATLKQNRRFIQGDAGLRQAAGMIPQATYKTKVPKPILPVLENLFHREAPPQQKPPVINNNKIEIKIDGSKDPKLTSQAVVNEIEHMMTFNVNTNQDTLVI